MVLHKDGLRELALFAGAGGGILGGMLHGWRTVAAVEIEDYPRRVLLQRQADGILPRFPVWDDVCTFDGTEWRGKVDVISGGFPCQDISCAGKGEGIEGSRSGLWGEMARIIREVGSRYVFVENSPMLTSRGLGVVLGDLAKMGYDARWGVLGACDAGAPHKRDRIWILATNTHHGTRSPQQERQHQWSKEPTGSCKKRVEAGDDVADANKTRLQRNKRTRRADSQGRQEPDGPVAECGCTWWDQDPADVGDPDAIRLQESQHEPIEKRTGGGTVQRSRTACTSGGATQPAVGRVAHGVAHRVDRLKAVGNGQVPAVAALAVEILGGPTQ